MFRGSHQRFWDYFYEGCNTIEPWVPNEMISAVQPVSGDRAWQITARNEVNYDMSLAFDAAVLLETSFNPRRLREVGGPLGQQFEITEEMLKLALYFANTFGVSSFPYEGLAVVAPRPKALRALVTKTPPGLVSQSALQEFFR